MKPPIIAILPTEIKGTGICSCVYTTAAEPYIDEKTPELLLDHLYKENGRSKKEMDRIIKRILQVSKNTPYVINATHVFFGFKHRTSTYDKNTRGFVNVRYVSHIKDNQIILTTGEAIDTLSKFDSLNTNKNQALTMIYREIIGNLYSREEEIQYLKGNILYK